MVPQRSSHGVRTLAALSVGKFFSQRSSPEQGAVARTLMRCSLLEKSGVGTSRVMSVMSVEFLSGWRRDFIVVGINAAIVKVLCVVFRFVFVLVEIGLMVRSV